MRKALILTAAIVLFACPAALAAYPGRDGQLAVQPVRGGGIELVHANGVGAHRICTDARLCGRPVHPRFSPTGRAIVFEDARSTHIGIVAPDGTCLWCLLGRPLTKGFGFAPAFASATAVTFTQETATSLSRASLTGGGTHRVAAAPATAAVTSSHGRLAVVRGSRIELRGPETHRFTRLTTGAAPAWSPRGTALAFTRGSWIWTIAARHGARPRRLVRGTSPAWSPSGGRIAYVAPGGAVTTITTGGRHRHRVGSVRGRSVDWQPLPGGAAPCSAGNGAIVAHSDTSVLREVIASKSPDTFLGWNGCLRAVGVARHLTAVNSGATCDGSIERTAARTVGRFAALGLSECMHALDNSCEVSTTSALFDIGGGMPTVLDTSLCGQTFSPVALDTSGFSAWRVNTDYLGPQATFTIACPSTTLCLAGDGHGVVSSTDPAAPVPTWRPAFLSAPVDKLSCPGTSFCLGATSAAVFTSTSPAGGASAWKRTPLPLPVNKSLLSAASCASPAFCVVGAADGKLFASTDPTAGTAAWHLVTLHTPPDGEGSTMPIDGVSCPSASLCVVVDEIGDTFTSTDPTNAAAWSQTATGVPDDVSCPSVLLCVAVGNGKIVTSTDPTGGQAAWSSAPAANGGLASLACGSPNLCVADTGTQLLTSTDPAGGAATWMATTPRASGLPIACAGTELCAMADISGKIAVTRDPAAGSASYVSTFADNGPCGTTATVCIGQQVFVDDDHGKRVVDQTTPSAVGPVQPPLSAPALGGNSLTATWFRGGVGRWATLR